MGKISAEIKAKCEAIGYQPADGFENKSEKQQLSMIKAKELEYARRDALKVLTPFVESPQFNELPNNVQDAIKLLAVKRTGGGVGGARRNVFMDNLTGFLSDIGDRVSEFEMFKATKMGRGEIRAKIRENLKNASPDDRIWVVLDAETEEWVLVGYGADQPEEWDGAPIDAAE